MLSHLYKVSCYSKYCYWQKVYVNKTVSQVDEVTNERGILHNNLTIKQSTFQKVIQTKLQLFQLSVPQISLRADTICRALL